MNERLKPCPFCGGKRIILDCWEGIHGLNYYVLCKKCKITLYSSDGFMLKSFDSAEAAVNAWNRRAEVPQRIDGKPAGMSAEQFEACYEDDSDA